MANAICSIEQCSRRAVTRGWCAAHYHRWQRYGDPVGKPLEVPARICSIEGCSSPHMARGWCSKHWQRWRRSGSTSDPEIMHYLAVEESFDARVDKRDPQECWNWLGSLTGAGYGQIYVDGKMIHVHRYAYTRWNGAIPDGLDIDHRCRNRRCCNPRHLRLATRSQNNENTSRARCDSKTGVRGVHFDARRDRYCAVITVDRVRHYLGSFLTLREAEDAAIAARLKYMTHNDYDRTGGRA